MSRCKQFPQLASVGFMVLLLLTITSRATTHAQEVTFDPAIPQIRVGNTAEVKITSTETITPADVKWTSNEFVQEVRTEMRGTQVVSVLKAIGFSSTNVELTVTVKGVAKKLPVKTLTSVLLADFPATPGPSPALKQDEPLHIPINNLVGVTIPSEGLEVSSADESAVTATRRGTSIVITGLEPSQTPVRITVSSNGQMIKTYDVTVTEAVESLEVARESIELSEGAPFQLADLNVKVRGKSQGDLTAGNTPTFESNSPQVASVSVDNKVLTAHRASRPGDPRPLLTIRAGGETKTIPINVRPAAKSINLGSQKPMVFKGQRETFTVSLKDTQDAAINAPVTWTLADAASQKCLRIVDQTNYEVTVEGIEVCPAATLTVTAATTPVLTNTLMLSVRDASPTGFAPLRIRIDVLDSQTAKDLFGKKAADEFFISKIRLFNNLKNQNGEYGDSILVYSESLEIQVQLEMKDKKGGSDWEPLLEKNSRGDSFIDLFGDPDKVDIPEGNPACQEKPQPNFITRYRPYTFDIVANTHDRRDERSTRSRVLTLANGLSSFASFVTTIAVPPAGNDLRLGLDQFKGLLIPSFEKLFTSLKEVQRQNIITMVMRPLEEIPFGSDVSRILFIPKGKLYGMAPGKIFRIGGVSTSGACAQVGIIKKIGSTPNQ